MLKKIVQISLVLSGAVVLVGCELDDSFTTTTTTTHAPVYTTGANQVTVTRTAAMTPSTSNVVTTTRQSTVVVNQNRAYNSSNAPVQAVTVSAPRSQVTTVRTQPVPVVTTEPVVRTTPSDVITIHNSADTAMSAPVIPVGGSSVSGEYNG